MHKGWLLIWTATLTVGCAAQHKPCAHREYMKTEHEADRLRSWSALYKSYKVHANCDDGAASEGYSESVARVLVDRWATLAEFATISENDPGFMRWVFIHIDATLDAKDMDRIRSNAISSCPANLKELCGSIQRSAETANGYDPHL